MQPPQQFPNSPQIIMFFPVPQQLLSYLIAEHGFFINRIIVLQLDEKSALGFVYLCKGIEFSELNATLISKHFCKKWLGFIEIFLLFVDDS